MDHYDQAQEIAGDLASKTEGIAHLLKFYRPEGTGPRDQEAITGIAIILEDLAKQGRALNEMLDSVNRPK